MSHDGELLPEERDPSMWTEAMHDPELYMYIADGAFVRNWMVDDLQVGAPLDAEALADRNELLYEFTDCIQNRLIDLGYSPSTIR